MEKKKIESFLIWGHGLIYLHLILEKIRKKNFFKILLLQEYKTKNIKKFVHKIYSNDYAPLFHIKSKIKYLLSTKPQAFFIFVENLDPREDYYGKDIFRHKQSISAQKFKEEVRNQFNPKNAKGEITHDHVIHSADNHEQVDSQLKLLGYSDGIKIFLNKKKIIPSPFYINEPTYFEIKIIYFDKLYCGQISEKNKKKTINIVAVQDSIQHKSLFNSGLYQEYVKKFCGRGLNQEYNPQKYFNLQNNFVYLAGEFQSNFIIVKKIQNDKFMIVDGLHRAALHLFQGNKSIKSCVIQQL